MCTTVISPRGINKVLSYSTLESLYQTQSILPLCCTNLEYFLLYDEDMQMKNWSLLCTESSMNLQKFSGVTKSLMTSYMTCAI